MAREQSNEKQRLDDALLDRRSYVKMAGSAAAAVAAGAGSAAAASSESSTSSPAIERFRVAKTEQLGDDQMFVVQWDVSDSDENLDVVEVVVADGSSELSFSVQDVSGGSASGWELFQFPVGSTLDVHLRVKDTDGNVTKDSENVTLGDTESPESEPDVHIPFTDQSDLETFTSVEGEYLDFVGDSGRQSDVLEVRIPEGNHYGTNSDFYFESETGSEPSEAYIEYYVYHPQSFEYSETGPGGSKLPGLTGTYGEAGWGGRPSDGTNGWSARVMNTNPDTAGTSRDLGLSFYVYHADQSREYGDLLPWDIGVNKGEWHKIGQYVGMNTPGEYDGIVRAWVDDDLAFEREDFKFRNDGYEHIKIEELWFNVYHGGSWTSPSDTAIRFSDLKIAKDTDSL